MSDTRRVGKFDEKTMRKAVMQVVKRGFTIRGVAKDFNLSYATLRQYVTKYNSTNKENRKSIRFTPNYEVNLIFPEELEAVLEQYLIVVRRLHYSLSSEDVRQLSYDLAVKHNLKVPPSWRVARRAGKHWMYSFLKRHPSIKKMLALSKQFRPPVAKAVQQSDLVLKSDSPEIIVPDDHIEEYVQSEIEEVDESLKPVIIIPLKKEKK